MRWCRYRNFYQGLDGDECKAYFFDSFILKTTKGAELIEANDIYLNNVQLFSDDTKPMIYVENASNIELNGIKYSPNPHLLLSLNGIKCGNIKFVNTPIANASDQIEYKYGATASMVSLN